MKKISISILFLTVLVLGVLSPQNRNWFRGPANSGPKRGEQAPDFLLRKVNSREIVQVSTHEGDKPVVLVFGSYT